MNGSELHDRVCRSAQARAYEPYVEHRAIRSTGSAITHVRTPSRIASRSRPFVPGAHSSQRFERRDLRRRIRTARSGASAAPARGRRTARPTVDAAESARRPRSVRSARPPPGCRGSSGLRTSEAAATAPVGIAGEVHVLGRAHELAAARERDRTRRRTRFDSCDTQHTRGPEVAAAVARQHLVAGARPSRSAWSSRRPS